MCKAFSCIINTFGDITWKMGVDSHSELARIAGYKDQQLGEFAKVEITPKNENYLEPDEWIYRVDESPVPWWFGWKEKELCMAAHKKWLRKLKKFLNPHPIVHPFEINPPKITAEHITLLRKWASVRGSEISVKRSLRDRVDDSVWKCVGSSVWDSVWDNVGRSVGRSVDDSVWNSVGRSVWDSVIAAYCGSFFCMPHWKNRSHAEGIYPFQPVVDLWNHRSHAERIYPFQPVVDLWNQGLVPTLDCGIWNLHGGKEAKVMFKISAEKLTKKNSN